MPTAKEMKEHYTSEKKKGRSQARKDMKKEMLEKNPPLGEQAKQQVLRDRVQMIKTMDMAK